ncbi:MAG: AAA family ATPase [Steroidobacteraceae bacterium]|jgi:general secretion pathway protein A
MNETYYGAFYGFRTAPFHITPDPSLLFLTARYEGALGAIEYGINAGKGFIVVSGEVGVGKTTVLRACLDRLDSDKTKIIYLFNSALTTADLYGTILDEFDPSLRVFMHPSDTLRLLLRKLLEAHQAGLQVVLAVDEAQNMPEQTLESLRILSNLETTKTKLLQIILVGQPELDAKLKKHSLRQLAQRVAVRARLKRLGFRESCSYIQHRTEHAGRSQSLFTAPAQWYIALAARGIPRTINICCDNALINGYGRSADRITLRIAWEASRSLEYRSPLRRAAALAGALILLLGAVIYGRSVVERFLPSPAAAPILHSHSSMHGPAANGTALTAPVSTKVAPAATQAPGPSVAPDKKSGDAQIPPNPADVPRTDAASDAGAARDKPAKNPEPPTSRIRWLVRKGDSVFKACLATYGSCDDETLRVVMANNPQIRSDGLIHKGEVIFMPASIGGLRAKRH